LKLLRISYAWDRPDATALRYWPPPSPNPDFWGKAAEMARMLGGG